MLDAVSENDLREIVLTVETHEFTYWRHTLWATATMTQLGT